MKLEWLKNRTVMIEGKVWITVLNNKFEEEWLPLCDESGEQMLWTRDSETKMLNPEIKMRAHQLFPNVMWGLANCEQKRMGNACIDNF